MNTKKIQIFADTLREKLKIDVVSLATFYGVTPNEIYDFEEYEDSIIINGNIFNKKIKNQRIEFVQKVKEFGYEKVIEEVTYTWFNRFVALKFMEMNNYFPVKVFTSTIENKTEPDILTDAIEISFMKLDKQELVSLKTSGSDEDTYKFLILSLCNHLNSIMPFLFEKVQDFSEMLFPPKLLRTDSLLKDLNTIISEEDWKEVEILGWLYQAFISKEKDKLIQAKKKYKESQVAKVTQLFTPKWIVKYMVQNSLGRYWLESNTDENLKRTFDFYLESRDKNIDDSLKNIINPNLKIEEIKFIDPAMGSGHILVYAFEVFFNIYKSQGYIDSEIPKLILEKNLYGLEIDNRATQIAQFALMMKAREFDKNLFDKEIFLNLLAIQESNHLKKETIKAFAGNDFNEIEAFFDKFLDAKVLGSTIKVDDFNEEFYNNKLEAFKKNGGMLVYRDLDLIINILKQAKLLNQKYDVAVANPPYLNSTYMPDVLKKFIVKEYPNTKSDLFSVFMELMLERTKQNGQIGMVTPYVWMFIKTYEWLREYIVSEKNFSSLIQLEYNSFPVACVPVCTFTIRNYKAAIPGEYIKLSEFRGSEKQPLKTLEAIKDPNVNYRFTTDSQQFAKIPGSPIAYWVSDAIRNIFKNELFHESGRPKAGISTGENNLFLKFWTEVSFNNINLNINNIDSEFKIRWYPYSKGGSFRKWYGNNEFVIDWENEGLRIKEFGKAFIRNYSFQFKEGLAWSSLSSSFFSMRYVKGGFMFDSKGPMAFPKSNIYYTLGFFNSNLSNFLLNIISPTLDYNPGALSKTPVIITNNILIKERIEQLSQENIDISKEEWDSRETSWNFKLNPLFIQNENKLEIAYKKYCEYWKNKFNILHKNEEELNKLFIDIYDLKEELTPEIPLEQITILNDEKKIKNGKLEFQKEVIVKQFLSYFVGCLFGRYNPEKAGLLLANQGDTIKEFNVETKFKPDEDNIVPITDSDYFKDDIVTRFKEFLKTYFGEENLSNNLDFIGSGIKGSGSSEEKIRKYFLSQFYKDHIRNYKKKPIYWLFSSGKEKGFNALIYMHRYNKELLAKMRVDYLHKLEDKVDAKINILNPDDVRTERVKSDLNKQLLEMKKYDEILNHMSSEYIEINLDDGFIINYPKFKELVEKI